MASTTSSSTVFTLDVDDIIEQALEPIGGEHTSGIDMAKARRTLNLLLIQMQNKEIPLSKIDFIEQALTDGTAEYTLPASVKDVLECTISEDDKDFSISRYNLRNYHQINNKLQEGRPTCFVSERGKDSVAITFWPIPNSDDFTAKFMVAKVIEDVTASYQKIDLPTRYLPLITKWLSYELAITRPGIPMDRIALLKAERDSVMPDTFEEDRERTDFIITPGGISGR